MEPKLTHLKIVYKNTVKLMTGLEEKTTFEDLIKAILVTKIPEEKKKQKTENDYIICQCVNGIEKPLNSNCRVREEIRKIQKEMEQYDTNVQVLYLMRSKKSLESTKKKRTYKEDEKSISIEKLINKYDFYIHERQIYIDLLEDYLSTLSFLEDQCQNFNQFDTEV